MEARLPNVSGGRAGYRRVRDFQKRVGLGAQHVWETLARVA